MGPVIHVYKAGSLVWAYEIRWGTAVSEPGSALTRKGAERRARRFVHRTIRTWDQERRTSYFVAVEDPK